MDLNILLIYSSTDVKAQLWINAALFVVVNSSLPPGARPLCCKLTSELRRQSQLLAITQKKELPRIKTVIVIVMKRSDDNSPTGLTAVMTLDLLFVLLQPQRAFR